VVADKESMGGGRGGGQEAKNPTFVDWVCSWNILASEIKERFIIYLSLTKGFINAITYVENSVADPDPGSGAFLTPGSGIRNRFFPDPGSRIPDPKPIFLRAQ
jgi:hypothetical protein